VKSNGVVLLVESDPDLRDRVGGWLEDAGLEVVGCPGPSRPDYTCIGVRRDGCALAHAAHLVVMDLWLGSDQALLGTSSTRLLARYLGWGKPVIAISARHDHGRLLKLFVQEELILLDWPPERRELTETVRAVLAGDRQKVGPSAR
jgi:DNA-binding response OmpR family regulator